MEILDRHRKRRREEKGKRGHVKNSNTKKNGFE